MRTFPQRAALRVLGLVILLFGESLSRPSAGLAEEFHFVIHEVDDNLARWSPSEVVLHTRNDMRGGLVFVLENPTARTHVFEAPGLFEQVVEGDEPARGKPLRATVAPEETLRIQVGTEPLMNDAAGFEGGEHVYRFFCPLHRGDADAGSSIRVVP